MVPIETNNGSVSIGIDDTPPIVTKDIGQPSYDDGLYIADDTQITLTAQDIGDYASGIKELHYILDSIETVVAGSTTQFVIPTPGNHTLEFWAIDNLDNEGTHTTQMHIVDTSAPSVSPTVIGPRVGSYINVNSTIMVTATDTGSGVKEIYYIVYYPNSTSTTYIISGSFANITFEEACNHTIDIWAVDNLNNAGLILTQTYHVDNTPPTSNASVYPYTQEAPINVDIVASDSGCNGGVGTKFVELWFRHSTDNTTWTLWTLFSADSLAPYNLTFTAPLGTGYYQFYTIAVDEVYNIEEPPVAPDAIANLTGDISYTQSLAQGWNLITVPVQHEFTAELLGVSITLCDAIAEWNASLQDYITHPVGSPIQDFDIEDGVSYFVHVTNNSEFTVVGAPIDNISVEIMPGWNLLGWVRTPTVSAEQFGNEIPGSDIVMRWSTTLQEYVPHLMGTPLNNFGVTHGMGLFVHTTHASTWDGEVGV